MTTDEEASMTDLLRADASALHAALIWIADLDVEAAARVRWRTEACDVLRRFQRALTASASEQRELSDQFRAREEELFGPDW